MPRLPFQGRAAFALGEAVEVRGGPDAVAGEGIGHTVRADMLDVGLAAVQRLGLLRVDVEADNGEARFLEEEGEREADVAEPDDAHGRRLRGDLLEKLFLV